MNERRNCAVVISKMLYKIPDSESKLIEELEWNMEDALYKAPEENIQWLRTSRTLQENIPEPTEEWEFEVLSIFSTEPVENIKKYYGVE